MYTSLWIVKVVNLGTDEEMMFKFTKEKTMGVIWVVPDNSLIGGIKEKKNLSDNF